MRLLVAWLLVAGSSSGAFVVEGHVIGAEFDLAGDYHATWDAVGAVVRGRGDYAWDAHADDAVVRLYNAPTEYARLQPTALTPEVSAFIKEHPLELLAEWRFTGSLGVEDETGKPYMQWIPTHPTEASCQCGSVQTLAVGAFQAAAQQASVQDRLGPHAEQFGVGAPPGKGAYVASTQPIEAIGEGRLVYFGAEVSVDDRRVWTGSRVNESRSAHIDGGGHYILDRVFAVVEGPLTLSASGPGAEWAVTGATIEGHVDLLVRRATGTVMAADQEHPLATEHLQVIGKLEAGAVFDDEAAWGFTGTGHFVGIDTVTVHGSRSWDAAPVVAAGLLTLLLGAWLASIFSRNRVLDHATRTAMLRHIRDEPGITRMELAERLGVGRATARHHLQCLVRLGLVAALPSGRNPAFVLAPRSSFDAQALAALGHPVRRRIYRTAVEETTFRAFQQEMAASTFTAHCQRLQQAGLFHRIRNGGATIWRAKIDFEEIRARLLEEFVQTHGNIIDAGEMTIHEPRSPLEPDAVAQE